MILRIVIVFGILIAAIVYIGRRMIVRSPLARRGRIVAWIAYLSWLVSVIALTIVGRDSAWPGGPMAWYTYVSLGLLSFVFFLLLIRDIALGIGVGVARLRRAPVDESRREHLVQLTNIGVLGAAGALTSYGIWEARRTPGIVEIDVPIARLPAALDGLRIVQITDIHAGLTVGREWIETVVEEVNALRPDLVAFTGDVVDGSVANLRDEVAPLASITAPLGLYFVTGNHEYYSGAEEWVREMGRLGYDVLMNEHRIVERNGARLVLGGITDFTAGEHVSAHRSDPAAALRGAPEDLARILMAHQPKSLRQTRDIPFDLMLSGHTHGGQFFPWNLATTLDQPYLSGLHRPDGRWIYVSRGTGYWGPPVRLGARSEITVVRLRAVGARRCEPPCVHSAALPVSPHRTGAVRPRRAYIPDMSPNPQHPVRRSAPADSTSTSRFLKASERLRDLRSLRHILSRAAQKVPIRLSEVRLELQDHVGLAVTVSETAHLCRLHLPSHSLYRPADEHHDVAAMPFEIPSVLCDADDGFSWSSRLCQGVEAAFDDVEHVSLELDESVPLHDCLDRRRLVRLAERCVDGQTHEVHVDHERTGERESDHLIKAMALAGFSSRFGEPQALLYYHEGFGHLGTIVFWPASGNHVGWETIDTLHAHESAIVELLTARIAVRQARLPQLRPAYRAVEVAASRWHLSPRQRDVLALVVKGLASTEIADALTVSQSTVNSHLAALYRVAGVNSMPGLLVAVLGPNG